MYCNNCGAKLGEGDSFCGNCGKPVNIENNTKPEEVQKNIVENIQTSTQPVQQEVPQPVKQTAVENSQTQQVSQQQPQSQPNTNTSTGYKSTKATFDSSKIVLTIVLGIVFFIIGFVCCKHYIESKMNNYLDDYYYYNDYDYGDYNYENNDNYDYDDNNYSESTSSSKNNNNNSLSYTDCFITNDDGTKVTLKLPSTLEISSYSSDVDYKTIKKVDEDSELTVTISVEDETIEEAINEVREEYADEEYKNVKMSDVKTINVGGRTYSYIEVEYYLSGIDSKYTSKYMVTTIDNDTLYGVVLEEYEDLTDRELTDLLTINVTK